MISLFWLAAAVLWTGVAALRASQTAGATPEALAWLDLEGLGRDPLVPLALAAACVILSKLYQGS